MAMQLPSEKPEEISNMLGVVYQTISEVSANGQVFEDDTEHAEEIMTLLEQLAGVILANAAADTDEQFSPEQAEEFGEYAISVVNGASTLLRRANKLSLQQHNEILSASLALWIGSIGGKLSAPDAFVNVVAVLANQANDSEELSELYHILGKLLDACSDEIKQDMQKDEQGRPWRVLHLNRCIVATRAQNTEMMEQAFGELISNLPNDASGFFAQGMSQVNHGDYPDEVRDLMQKYHDEHHSPVIAH